MLTDEGKCRMSASFSAVASSPAALAAVLRSLRKDLPLRWHWSSCRMNHQPVLLVTELSVRDVS